MNLKKLELQKENCREKLLEYLNGEIFHLRPYQDFEKIISSGHLQNSKDGNYSASPSSDNSFGGNQGYICLFDLINQSNENINNGIARYNFILPGWFKSIHETYNEYNLCYFILNRNIYGELIPNEEGRKQHEKTGENYIPHIEVWHPTKINLKDISKVLIVKITEAFHNNNSFGRAMELIKKKNA